MVKIRTAFLTLTLSLLAFAQVWANEEVHFIKRSWDAVNKVVVSKDTSISEYTVLSGTDKYGEYTLKSNKWYVVKSSFGRYRTIAPSGSAANLIICDGAILTGHITIEEGDTLNIYGQELGSGEIQAKSISYSYNSGNYQAFMEDEPQAEKLFAAIGGGLKNGNMGALVIHGGTITARSGMPPYTDYTAGIGGGEDGNGGSVIIYGGTIKAYGGKDAAGIGSGEQQSGVKHGGSLTIYGGTVEAHGGKHGAGIGGGQDASGATVVIYGGIVSAYGGADAAGIGSGEEFAEGPINGGSLTVYGGEVFADGTDWGAGIGGGEDADGANVEIYGGTVTAWAGADAGKRNGSAIGCAKCDGNYGTLHISGDMRVYAGNDANNPKLFTYDQRVPASRWRPYARIVPCAHSYTYTIDRSSNPSTHTGSCKYCGRVEGPHAHSPESDGHCGVCGYNVGTGYWTVTLAKPRTDGSGNPQIGDNGGYVYEGTSMDVAKGRPVLLPTCDVMVNGYKFVGWSSDGGGTLYNPGDEYVAGDHVTLKATYKEIRVVTVAEPASSNPNGSYTTYKDTVAWNEDYVFPNASSPEGYAFVGWYVGSIEDLVDGGYSLKPEIQNPSLYRVDDVLTNVTSDKEIVAVYVRTGYGAVTIAVDSSSAVIDGAYANDDETVILGNITVQSVALNRTFVKDQFSTLVLPFEIAVGKVHGAKFYGLTEMSNADGKWTAGASAIGESGVLAANTPYLVKPEASTITFDGSVTLNTSGSHKSTQGEGEWEFQGAYQYIVFGNVKSENPQNTYYGFAANTQDGYTAGQFAKAGDNAFIYPMRAYLVHVGANGNAKDASGLGLSDIGSLPETIDVKIMDEQGKVTEVATFNTVTGEIKRDRWFDLQGRQLKGKPSIKGKYLHNGKVEVVK